jgi:hypothetical protein
MALLWRGRVFLGPIMAIDQTKIDRWFKPLELKGVLPHQSEQIEKLRATAKHYAETIVTNTPQNADQSDAVRKVRESLSTATAAIISNC